MARSERVVQQREKAGGVTDWEKGAGLVKQQPYKEL